LANLNSLYKPAEMPSKYQAITEEINHPHLPIIIPGGQKEVAKEEAKAKVRMVTSCRTRGEPLLSAKRTQK